MFTWNDSIIKSWAIACLPEAEYMLDPEYIGGSWVEWYK